MDEKKARPLRSGQARLVKLATDDAGDATAFDVDYR